MSVVADKGADGNWWPTPKLNPSPHARLPALASTLLGHYQTIQAFQLPRHYHPTKQRRLCELGFCSTGQGKSFASTKSASSDTAPRFERLDKLMHLTAVDIFVFAAHGPFCNI